MTPTLVAAPPGAWFTDPQLGAPTALTVTEDGRVFGHIAAFGTPHMGLGDDTEAPRSRSDYRYFRTGAVLTADGAQVPVGHITLGTGHASLEAGVTAAAEHYDNTGTAVADVAIGEDEHGIWCAGTVRPGATAEQVHALRASPISGDWRAIGEDLELVAALAVNVPGFPVPRSVAAAGVPMALVAAGSLAAAAAAPPKKESKKQPAAKGGEFNAKHPRAAKGSSTGGQFAPAGKARNADGQKAQDAAKANPKTQADYKALLAAKPADRAAALKGLKDSELENLSRLAYSFKSSDPKVVASRIAVANELAKRGKDVKQYGALGGGTAKKPVAKKPAGPPPAKKPVAKKPVAKKPVRASAAGTHPSTPKGTAMPVTFTDDEMVVMRHKLGLAEDATSALIASALVEALDEQVEDAPEAVPDEVAAPGAPAVLPAGLVAVDAQLLEELKAKAARGDAARAQQERDTREALVASAVKEGRVAPARREHWVKQLEADPGASAVLASLKPVVPVGDPIGHDAGAPDAAAADDYWFPGVVSTSSSREG